MIEPLNVLIGALLICVPLALAFLSGWMAWRGEIRHRSNERDLLVGLVRELKVENRNLKQQLSREGKL